MASSSTTMPMEEGGEIILCSGSFFDDLPEGCIASIISFTTPTDACSLALVSKDFLSASESDIVWERFLPSDYHQIIARSDDGELLLTEFHNKKQLYLRLSDRPLLIDDASKSFWLEKSTGKKCWMISARSMSIIWGDTPIYWNWTSIPESRFPEVAELVSVCWLEIRGNIRISMLSPNTQYVGYLVFKTTEGAYGLDEVLETSVQNARGEINTQRAYLDGNRPQQRARPQNIWGPLNARWGPLNARWGPLGVRVFSNNNMDTSRQDHSASQRNDGWRELKIGEFFTHLREEDDEVELAVKEVTSLNWKRGLIVEGIEFRPI